MCTSIHLEAYYVTVLENFVDPIRTPEGQKVLPSFFLMHFITLAMFTTKLNDFAILIFGVAKGSKVGIVFLEDIYRFSKNQTNRFTLGYRWKIGLLY